MTRRTWTLGLLAMLPVTMGAKGGCGGPINSTEDAPDVSGAWSVQYDGTMEVEVGIGGAVYHQTLSASGGAFTVQHGGKAFDFNIDCTRADVVCPSEVWPDQVTIDQRDATYQHRMWVQIPVQSCSVKEVAPDPKTCGTGTLNPDCKPVCDGQVTTKTAEAFGVINDAGNAFDLLLGAGVASNGKNCALLGLSGAHATLVNTGVKGGAEWQSQQMKDGTVKTAYAGGCLWAGDANMDGQTEALVVGASVLITTPFTAARVN